MINKLERTIRLSKNVIDAWSNDHEDKISLLEAELIKSDQLISLINEYQIDRYLARTIDILTVEPHDEKTGTINLVFMWELYSGCKDFPHDAASDLDFFFTIDFDKSLLHAKGEEIRERDTVDEY